MGLQFGISHFPGEKRPLGFLGFFHIPPPNENSTWGKEPPPEVKQLIDFFAGRNPEGGKDDIWSNYSDLTWFPHPKWCFSNGIPLGGLALQSKGNREI